MQLGEYYADIIRITMMDALVIGAGAGLLVATYFGMKIRRERDSAFSDSFYGIAGVILGTLFGYISMNAVGYIVALSGSPFHGFSGADLLEWKNSTSFVFTQSQVHAIGFAMLGSWFGIGWGYGIRADDTSLSGNIFATLGLIGLLGGLLFLIMPALLYQSPSYITFLNGLLVLCYVIALQVTKTGNDSSPEPEDSERDEMIG